MRNRSGKKLTHLVFWQIFRNNRKIEIKCVLTLFSFFFFYLILFPFVRLHHTFHPLFKVPVLLLSPLHWIHVRDVRARLINLVCSDDAFAAIIFAVMNSLTRAPNLIPVEFVEKHSTWGLSVMQGCMFIIFAKVKGKKSVNFMKLYGD